MKKWLMVTMIVAAGIALSGCPKKPTVKGNPNAGTAVPEQGGASSGDTGPQTGAATPFGESGGAAGAAAAVAGRIIYFDYDKVEIKPEYAGIVTEVAHALSMHPAWKIRLEGNTDERGTREYNIGLGERRAQAVRRALMLQGAADTQLSTVSYGEERPAVEGETEAAFAKNRRVEMVAVP
ncbi:MAG: peptidoglycan-associated lipoprotein Pal [Proteobacteria bacterium]|nr:peptidoglycan-associated lipoprotein Pal [Pseudomonadota bacterium]